MSDLKSVAVDFEEFPKLIAPCNYDFSSLVAKQIFLFLDNVESQVANFFLKGDEEGRIDLAQLNVYKRFGIYTDHTNVVDNSKEYLLILEPSDLVSRDTLIRVVDTKCQEFGCETFKFVAIKCKYLTNEERTIHNDLINDVLPYATVLNSGFKQTVGFRSEQKLKYDKENYVNIADLCEGLMFNGGNLTLIVQNVNKLCEKMLEYRGKRVIFYCHDTDPRGMTNQFYCKFLVVSMAAYFAMEYGYLFEFTDEQNSDYLRTFREMVSSNYNYASEYLRLINNPINVGFKIIDNHMFLAVRDDNKIRKCSEEYLPEIGMLCVPFDLNRKMIKDSTVVRKIYKTTTLQFGDIQHVFGVDSLDWNEAYRGMYALTSLFSSFEKVLKASEFGLQEPLFVNKVLLFEEDGEWYLGFIHSLKGKVPYVVVEANYEHPAFTLDVSLEDLPQVYDLNLLTDKVAVEKLVKKANWGGGVVKHYKLPKSARGVIFRNIMLTASRLTENCGASIEELGLWTTTTAQLRINRASNVLQHVSLQAAHNAYLLTCFGGPHHALTVDILLGENGGNNV